MSHRLAASEKAAVPSPHSLTAVPFLGADRFLRVRLFWQLLLVLGIHWAVSLGLQVPPRCFINIFQFIILEFLGADEIALVLVTDSVTVKQLTLHPVFLFPTWGASMLGSMLWSSRTGFLLRKALGLISHFSVFVLSFALFSFLIFLRHGLLCNPCWLLAQRDLPTYASRVLGSKVYSTHIPQLPLECFRTHGGSPTFRFLLVHFHPYLVLEYILLFSVVMLSLSEWMEF